MSISSVSGSKEVIIGIDLGTTNSCVAFMKDGAPRIIAEANAARTIASTIFYDNDQPVVGVDRAQAILHSAKRFMGRSYEEMEPEIKSVPFKVLKDEYGMPVFEIDGKKVTPKEASAQILVKMKQIAEKHLGVEVKKAVVAVPAYFDSRERAATWKACEMAGLSVVRMISEPTAAALAYGIGKGRIYERVAIYDLGGGTFDISLIELDEGIFHVRSVNGNTHLGGDDFDSAIVDWMIAECKKAHQVNNLQEIVELHHLRKVAAAAKVALSSWNTVRIEVPTESGLKFPLDLTRQRLDEICRPLIEMTRELCLKAMKDIGFTPEHIDRVVLVGGMTRMPAVREMIKEIFRREPETSINPDEAVALGAAIQAGIISGDIDNILLIDVTPFSLSVDSQGLAVPLISRNTSIPSEYTRTFTTVKDNQSKATIRVLQGERLVAAENKEIACFDLEIPPAPRGQLPIDVTFSLDADGLLSVKAEESIRETKFDKTGNSPVKKF